MGGKVLIAAGLPMVLTFCEGKIIIKLTHAAQKYILRKQDFSKNFTVNGRIRYRKRLWNVRGT